MSKPPLSGRIIHEGQATGEALCCEQALSFYGGFDLNQGIVTEVGHELYGQCVSGKILVFPAGKGSTVGSYALLRLVRNGVAPSALVMERCDTTVAVGAIIAEIPCVDHIDIHKIQSGDQVTVQGGSVWIT